MLLFHQDKLWTRHYESLRWKEAIISFNRLQIGSFIVEEAIGGQVSSFDQGKHLF